MKRRPKGMGCVAFLGTGRRKPYVATLKKKCIGTFKSEADAQKALLGVVLNQCALYPDYTPVSYTHLTLPTNSLV